MMMRTGHGNKNIQGFSENIRGFSPLSPPLAPPLYIYIYIYINSFEIGIVLYYENVEENYHKCEIKIHKIPIILKMYFIFFEPNILAWNMT